MLRIRRVKVPEFAVTLGVAALVFLLSCIGASCHRALSAPAAPLPAAAPVLEAGLASPATPLTLLQRALAPFQQGPRKDQSKTKYGANTVFNSTIIVGNENEVKQAGQGKSKGPTQMAQDSGATQNTAEKQAQLNNAPNNKGSFAPSQEQAQSKPWYQFLLQPLGIVAAIVAAAAVVAVVLYVRRKV